MTTIAIPDHTYLRLAALATLRNLTPDALAADALEKLVREPIANGNPVPRTDAPSRDEWTANFDAWMAVVEARAHLYPPGHFVDDSRESIYEGCGE